jgi:hypothetical protein
MTTTQLIILIAVVLAIVVALAARSGGPRVTQITTRREKVKPKDGDHA